MAEKVCKDIKKLQKKIKINKKTKSSKCTCFVFNKQNVVEPKENYARNVSPLSEPLPGMPSPGLPGGVK